MKTTIPDHYDTLALITDKSNPAHEFEVWQAFARQNPEDWNGDEFTLADFEAYIASQKDCMGHLSGRTETQAPAAPVLRQHTPGPWRVARLNCVEANHAEGWAPVATVYTHDSSGNQLEANAHLIAAAPDLLAALQELVSWVPSDGWHTDAPLKAIAEARAAIAKATGGQAAPLKRSVNVQMLEALRSIVGPLIDSKRPDHQTISNAEAAIACAESQLVENDEAMFEAQRRSQP